MTSDKMEDRRLEIVVIEDTPRFLEIAKQVANRKTSLSSKFFQSYEPAIKYLKENKIDGVVTDLFFPSELDIQKEILSNERETREKLRLEKGISGEWALLKYDVPTFGQLTENPSGLAIAEYCTNSHIPYLMLSHGDSHARNLQLVGEALAHGGLYQLGYKKHIYAGLIQGFTLYDLLLYGGGRNIDKAQEKTWEDAFNSIQAKIIGDLKK
jgi:hypothetical protein